MTDVETIQLQIMKLAPLKTDERIQEIITVIQAENYALAQRLITRYIETPTENILQRTSQKSETSMTLEDQAVIDEFDLFITSDTQGKQKEVDINDFFADSLPAATKAETKKENHADFESIFNIDVDNVPTDYRKQDAAAYTSQDSFFEASRQNVKQSIDNRHIAKDTFFDTGKTIKTETLKEPAKAEEPAPEETVAFAKKGLLDQNEPFEELKPLLNVQKEEYLSPYKAIPYIAQKLDSMQKTCPPVDKTYEKFDSVEDLLRKISRESYTEEEIEETLKTIKTLTEETNYAEAAQLLLICAATESKFAQFMLARELYKGVLFEKNIPEGFTRMYSLAMEDFPEALCDLAQFYEHGVGIEKDKKKAEQFYKEAMDFGIKRAEQHHARLKKQNRGFFGLRR